MAAPGQGRSRPLTAARREPELRYAYSAPDGAADREQLLARYARALGWPCPGRPASLRSADRPRIRSAFSRSRPALGSLSLATTGRLRENPFLNCHTRYGRRCGAAYLAGGLAGILRTPASPWTPRYRFGTVKICSSGSVGRAAALPRKTLRQLCTPKAA